jgi:hypothetical protein
MYGMRLSLTSRLTNRWETVNRVATALISRSRDVAVEEERLRVAREVVIPNNEDSNGQREKTLPSIISTRSLATCSSSSSTPTYVDTSVSTL